LFHYQIHISESQTKEREERKKEREREKEKEREKYRVSLVYYERELYLWNCDPREYFTLLEEIT
jgi:hypothetical protein